MINRIYIFTCAVVLLLAAGCSTSKLPASYNVMVELDQSVQGSSILVDIVMVNDQTKQRLEAFVMDDYWQLDNPYRKSLRKVSYELGAGKPTSMVLPFDQAEWKHWLSNGGKYLAVLADLPISTSYGGPQNDRRKLFLPLQKRCWSLNRTKEAIHIGVKSDALDCKTPHREPINYANEGKFLYR